jgi:hypothetical protein
VEDLGRDQSAIPAPLRWGAVDQLGDQLEQAVVVASVAAARGKRMLMAWLGPRSAARSRQVSSEE